VKKLLQRLAPGAHASPEPATGDGDGDTLMQSADSGFFTTLFMERDGEEPLPMATWAQRAQAIGAQGVPRVDGEALFAAAWAQDRQAAALGPEGMQRLGAYLEFAKLPADCEAISQDEQGDFLLIVLDGAVAVDRLQPWGGRVRLGEARTGDLLGEMSLLDAGTRFSACRTLGPCTLAVLQAAALDRMMAQDPRLAAALLATLARRLSLRLRQSSARLSALLAQQ
jgi:CRP/FNR family transcriptional regulator, cyclic AMP receptor protein